jgi:hypothetical protein
LELELLYDCRFTAHQFILATSPSRLNTSGYSPHVTTSLMRGWVCRLHLLLVLASAVILGSKSCGTHDIFYCLKFETPPTWRARSPYLYPPGIGWPSYTPRHWVPFSSPPTTRRAMVEEFEPASTRFDLNGLLYSIPVSTVTPLDSTVTCWFPRIYHGGNVFVTRSVAMGLHVTICW